MMDPDEVEQVRGYIETRLLRQECAMTLLDLGVVNDFVLRLFSTGDEGWQIAIRPGSPDLN